MEFLLPINPNEEDLLVAKLVGQSMKTIERYFENIRFRQLKVEIVDVKRNKMEDGYCKTFGVDTL